MKTIRGKKVTVVNFENDERENTPLMAGKRDARTRNKVKLKKRLLIDLIGNLYK